MADNYAEAVSEANAEISETTETKEGTESEQTNAVAEVGTDTAENTSDTSDVHTSESDDGSDSESSEEETEEEPERTIWDILAEADKDDEEYEEDDDDEPSDSGADDDGAEDKDEDLGAGDTAAKSDNKVDYSAMAEKDLAEINKAFGTNYTAINQIPSWERFCDLRDNGDRSLSAAEAYGAVTAAKRVATPPSKAHQTSAVPQRRAPKPEIPDANITATSEVLGVSRKEAIRLLARAKKVTF